VINAELTLAKWDGMSPIIVHRDYMKELPTRLDGPDLAITDLQLYNHFVNSLPADYDMIVARYQYKVSKSKGSWFWDLRSAVNTVEPLERKVPRRATDFIAIFGVAE
jgi:hypothetical protein